MSDDIIDADELFYAHPDWPMLVEKTLSGHLSDLDDLQRTRYLLGILLGEVGNGGVEQWFQNQGALAGETVEALRNVAAFQTADKLVTLGAFFPDGRPSADDHERAVQIESLSANEEFQNEMDSFDKWLMGDMVSDEEFVFGDEDILELFSSYQQRMQIN